MARPRKEIDREQFEKLCALQCTLEEIASWFKCSEDTIERWCLREYEQSFADSYKDFSVEGKISLRRIQFKQAEKSYSMAIWLGKQWLGQREYIEAELPQMESTIEKIAKQIVRGKENRHEENNLTE